jgi:hypothetical protein
LNIPAFSSAATRILRAIILCLALIAAGPLGAQTIRGVLVDSAAAPVPGALMVLVYPGGAATPGALTDAQGRFTLIGALPGRYTVRAERTGYRTVQAEVELGAGQTVDVRLVTGIQVFVLPTVQAIGESRCTVRPGRGMAAYTLWDEARKALQTAAYLQDAQRVEYTVRTYRVEVAMRTGRIRREYGEPRRVTGRPFQTLAPQALAAGGYVRADGDSIAFYGPDAHVLLSDEFLDTHCLYVDPRAAAGQTVALVFEPIRRKGVVDIRGVLRMDRRTGDLQEVEYTYTDLRGATRQSPAGGTVEFLRLADGAWVVSRWRIRSTSLAGAWNTQRGRTTQTITDMREAGGEVTEVEMVEAPDGSMSENASAVEDGNQ